MNSRMSAGNRETDNHIETWWTGRSKETDAFTHSLTHTWPPCQISACCGCHFLWMTGRATGRAIKIQKLSFKHATWVLLRETTFSVHCIEAACFPLCSSSFYETVDFSRQYSICLYWVSGCWCEVMMGEGGDGLQGETGRDRSELSWPWKDSSTLTLIEIFYQNTFSQTSLIINPTLI